MTTGYEHILGIETAAHSGEERRLTSPMSPSYIIRLIINIPHTDVGVHDSWTLVRLQHGDIVLIGYAI